MTLANAFFARFRSAFSKDQSDAPDAFDLRLQKLSSAAMRQIKHPHALFKNRPSRLAA